MSSVFGNPVFAIVVTVAIYLGALRVHRRWLWANPLITGAAALVAVLWALKVPYSRYRVGGDVFTYLLGPETVALAVPMYKQVQVLRKEPGAAAAGGVGGGGGWDGDGCGDRVGDGGVAHVCCVGGAQVGDDADCGAGVRGAGGDPAITIAMVLLTGLLGAVMGPAVLRLVGIRHEHAVGAAVGAASHAIGTASLIRQSEVQGSVSSLAMVLAGVVTSVLAMGLGWIWR